MPNSATDAFSDILSDLGTPDGGPQEVARPPSPHSEASSTPQGPAASTDPPVAQSLEARIQQLEHPGLAAEVERARVEDHRRMERARISTALRRHLDLLTADRTQALDRLEDAIQGDLPKKPAVDALYLTCRKEYSLHSDLYGRSIVVERPVWLFPVLVHSRSLTHPSLENPLMYKKVSVPLPEAVQSLLRQLDLLELGS